MKRFDNDVVWAVAAVIVVLLVGSYYESLQVRDQAAVRVCQATKDGRLNLNRRSAALADYITTVLRLNAAVDKIQPPPPKLAKLKAQEIAAIRHLRSEQRPLPLVSCP